MMQSTEAYEMPWLVFKLQKQAFAINSTIVETIFLLEQPIVEMPEYPKCIRGIINLRGQIVPLLELRQVLGMPSFLNERNQFYDTLDQRKADHVNWVRELKRCLDEDDDFKLATDPHKCAFGKWYDNFVTDNQTINFHLRQIDEPHKKLHGTAQEAFSCKRECEACERDECVREKLLRATDIYMPEVLRLIDEAKVIFEEEHREMCVVLRDESEWVGILVDEVVAVEPLEVIPGKSALEGMFRGKFVSDIAKSETRTDQILVLDQESLFNSAWS